MDKNQAITKFRKLLGEIENVHNSETRCEDVSRPELARLYEYTKNILYPMHSGSNTCAGCFANRAVKGGGCAILTERMPRCKFKKTNSEYEAGIRDTHTHASTGDCRPQTPAKLF